MATAYRRLTGRLGGSLSQYGANTGRRLSREEIGSILGAEAEQRRLDERQAADLSLRERQLRLQEEAYADQSMAANISGAGNLLQLGLGTYSYGKQQKWWGTPTATATTTGIPTTNVAPYGLSSGTLGTQSSTVSAGTVPASNAPAYGYQGGSLTQGVSGTEYGSGVTASSPATAGSEFGVGTFAASAGLGYAAGTGAQYALSKSRTLREITPGGGKTKTAIGATAAGAAAGTAVAPGWGTVVGGVFGYLSTIDW